MRLSIGTSNKSKTRRLGLKDKDIKIYEKNLKFVQSISVIFVHLIVIYAIYC